MLFGMGDDKWTIEVSDEVAEWLCGLRPRDRGRAQRSIDRLEGAGPLLRMPHSRQLSAGLWELRFRCADVNQRITYTIAKDGTIVLLTQFRKQRNNERSEFLRARNCLIRLSGEDR